MTMTEQQRYDRRYGRTYPTLDNFMRLSYGGMTRHTLEEITTAAAELIAAETDHDAADEEAASVMAPHDGYPGWELYATPEMQQLLKAVQSGGFASDCGPGSGELWPAGKYRKYAAKHRAATKKIRRAITAAQEQAP